MPLYGYVCHTPLCQNNFDRFTSIAERDSVKCPKCEKPAQRQEVNNTSFVLKGKGWFKTHGSY